MSKDTKTRPVCPKCGFKIRGPNHDKGLHHNLPLSPKMKPKK